MQQITQPQQNSNKQLQGEQKIASYDTRNEGIIHDAQYDYYGKRLATCNSDGYIHIYDVSKVTSITKQKTFKAHAGPVWQITWAHPRFGNILATCSFDKKVILWKESNQSEWDHFQEHSIHKGSVNTIAWAPQEYGLKLAAGSSDGYISCFSNRMSDQTWSVFSWQAHDMGINAVSWCPYVKYSDVSNDKQNDNQKKKFARLASGGCDKSIIIWEFQDEDKAPVKILYIQGTQEKGHQDWVRDLAWSPQIGNNYELIASCSEDKTIRLWKITDLGLQSAKYECIILKELTGPAWRVSWSLTGNILAASAASQGKQNSIQLFQENENGVWECISKKEEDDLKQ